MAIKAVLCSVALLVGQSAAAGVGNIPPFPHPHFKSETEIGFNGKSQIRIILGNK